MSEKPNDGTVAMYHGEIEDSEFLAAEDYLPTLPNTVSFIVHVIISHRRFIFSKYKQKYPFFLWFLIF